MKRKKNQLEKPRKIVKKPKNKTNNYLHNLKYAVKRIEPNTIENIFNLI